TVAGNGQQGFGGDNGPATSASFFQPRGIAVDASGAILISDTFNERVRKVDPETRVITTVAGNGNQGFGGDNGPATQASLRFLLGITVDGSGNLFICDVGNHRLRKVDAATKIITTSAGNGSFGFSGDGGPA